MADRLRQPDTWHGEHISDPLKHPILIEPIVYLFKFYHLLSYKEKLNNEGERLGLPHFSL